MSVWIRANNLCKKCIDYVKTECSQKQKLPRRKKSFTGQTSKIFKTYYTFDASEINKKVGRDIFGTQASSNNTTTVSDDTVVCTLPLYSYFEIEECCGRANVLLRDDQPSFSNTTATGDTGEAEPVLPFTFDLNFFEPETDPLERDQYNGCFLPSMDRLNVFRTVLVKALMGYGKTMMAFKMVEELSRRLSSSSDEAVRGRVLILTQKKSVIEGWKSTGKQVFGELPGVLSGSITLKKLAKKRVWTSTPITLGNIINKIFVKRYPKSKKVFNVSPERLYELFQVLCSFEIVVYDEVHEGTGGMLCLRKPTKPKPNETSILTIGRPSSTGKNHKMFPSVLHGLPRVRWLIGMSATPKRSDGGELSLGQYFGPSNDYIIPHMKKKDIHYLRIATHFQPEVEETLVAGEMKLKWSTVITSIAGDSCSNKLVADVALKCIDLGLKPLVVTDRKDQTSDIHSRLQQRLIIDEKIDNTAPDFSIETDTTVDFLCGNKTTFDSDALALVGGVKKIGTGFNDPTLDVVIFASDIGSEDNIMLIKQVIGRIRKQKVYVIDFEVNLSSCTNHALVRRDSCKELSSEEGTTVRYPKRGRVDQTDEIEVETCVEKVEKFLER